MGAKPPMNRAMPCLVMSLAVELVATPCPSIDAMVPLPCHAMPCHASGCPLVQQGKGTKRVHGLEGIEHTTLGWH